MIPVSQTAGWLYELMEKDSIGKIFFFPLLALMNIFKCIDFAFPFFSFL